MTQCIDCENLRLKGDAEANAMARAGFGRCAKQKNWHFVSITYKRDCESFQAADAEKQEARKIWMEKQS